MDDVTKSSDGRNGHKRNDWLAYLRQHISKITSKWNYMCISVTEFSEKSDISIVILFYRLVLFLRTSTHINILISIGSTKNYSYYSTLDCDCPVIVTSM